jgi:FAD/FMN-containing dehydrogenase
VREYIEALDALTPTGGYVNFLAADDGSAGLRARYRENCERLAAIKLAYDPQNLFHMNQNIEPAPAGFDRRRPPGI